MNSKFGKKLRELRLKAGLSVRELAERANLHYSYISKLENGQLPPPEAQKVMDLADALGFERGKLLAIAERLPRSIVQRFRLSKSIDFGAALKRLRLKGKLSQNELAARTGINATYISKMENQLVPPPSDDVIVKLAAALNTRPGSLLKRAGKTQACQQIMEQRFEGNHSRRDHMTKLLKSPLALTRLGLALVLVVSFSVALWAASPKPAKAITVGVTNPASATIGSGYQFTVTINVESADLLPVQKVNVTIQSVTNPGLYSVTLVSLPIPSTPSTTLTASYPSASVSGTSSANWGYATDPARTGFGYRTTGGTGTIGGTGYGYGYGLGTHTLGTATLTYTITWTPPANWSTSDTYKIIVLSYLTAGDANAFTQTSTNTFTLAAAAGGAPAGGGGAPEPGTLTYGPDNRTIIGTTVTASTGTMSITVPAGTTATVNGLPVTKVTVSEVITDEWSAAPVKLLDAANNPIGSYAVGGTFNLEPSGATFNPAITVTMKLPAGVSASAAQGSKIAFFNKASGQWVTLENIEVHADGTISGKTTHFTIFALLIPAPTPTTPTPTPTPTPTSTPTPTVTTPKPTVTVPPTTPIVTNVPMPGPSVTSTVILPTPSGAGGAAAGTNWLWPIVIGVIGAIVMVFVVRWGWNLRRD